MNDGVNAYPLSWPIGWERTESYRRQVSQFASRSLAAARDFVLGETRLLRASSVVISTNVPLRQDGLAKSGQRNPEDPGVAVYFLLKGKARVLACDKWQRVEDNLWAIGKHIEAMRGQQRWGVGSLDQAFTGYAALPAPAVNWWEILGVERSADLATIQAAFWGAAKQAHPDTGGSNESFLRVQAAWDAARKEKS